MASEINREEFLGISFLTTWKFYIKQRIFMRYFSISIRQSSTSGTNMIYVIVLKEAFMQRMVLLQIKKRALALSHLCEHDDCYRVHRLFRAIHLTVTFLQIFLPNLLGCYL